MSEAAIPSDYLGPKTEERFAAAFAQKAVVGIGAAAGLLGLDEKTVEALTEARVIRSVPKGAKHRGYTERDLRAYLIESPELPCVAPEPKPRAKPQQRPNLRVVNFSERKRQKD